MSEQELMAEVREACARAMAKLGGTEGAATARYKAAALEKLGVLGCVPMDQFPQMVRHVLWAYGKQVDEGDEPDVFTLYLLRTMQKASSEQLGRLADAYPGYAALVQLVREGDRRLMLMARDVAAQAAR